MLIECKPRGKMGKMSAMFFFMNIVCEGGGIEIQTFPDEIVVIILIFVENGSG